ncbi:ArsR/SmtB family transcription factor [Devosia sp.]|uniref:ArsR/SmtB family transcription factor n=1 Tax=Devosia sp. TaxID=1871048 RepID=UPI002FCBA00A
MPPIAILVALADPTRCRIIEILRDGPQPVHVLAGSFDISRPAISRHLRVLKQARLISEKKAGRENRYALHANQLRPVAAWLAELAPIAETVSVGQPAPAIVRPAPQAVPTPAPVPEVTPAPVASRQRREPSVSQMGFDF